MKLVGDYTKCLSHYQSMLLSAIWPCTKMDKLNMYKMYELGAGDALAVDFSPCKKNVTIFNVSTTENQKFFTYLTYT